MTNFILLLMESTNNIDIEIKHSIFIKDKHGVHCVQPFIDQTKILLTVANASIVLQSNNLVGVIIIHLLIFILIDNSRWFSSSLRQQNIRISKKTRRI